ncbi:putative cofilin/tropomyosin-type actin-binding protein [Blattamonas nauphoetae]|uniref:Cofilin/tropomyosin-type actin-binding protein n=1 Tax=Blattamonas nauphoetae TaxID=2049346 RepID=A0ABQ9XKT5_9EUKA|nr:putative cofilin/tropomyosin-type actin-binding protein [Blattamonas nauphoetae]
MTYTTRGPIQVKDEETIAEAVKAIRDDSSQTDLIVLGYDTEKQNAITLIHSGGDGFDGMKSYMQPEFMGYALLRLISGDAESKRTKFVFVSFSGEKVSLVKKGKMGTHVSEVNNLLGYSHISIQASTPAELDLDSIKATLKKAGGADYDTGSNKHGYDSNVGSIRKEGAQAYSQ